MGMLEDIRTCADRILVVLDGAGQMNILRLAESLDERSILVYQALGWLAREGLVRYSQSGTRVFVSRAPASPPADEGDRRGGDA